MNSGRSAPTPRRDPRLRVEILGLSAMLGLICPPSALATAAQWSTGGISVHEKSVDLRPGATGSACVFSATEVAGVVMTNASTAAFDLRGTVALPVVPCSFEIKKTFLRW